MVDKDFTAHRVHCSSWDEAWRIQGISSSLTSGEVYLPCQATKGSGRKTLHCSLHKGLCIIYWAHSSFNYYIFIIYGVHPLRERNPSAIMALTTSRWFSSKCPRRTPALAVHMGHYRSAPAGVTWTVQRMCAYELVTDTKGRMGSELLPALEAKGNLSALCLSGYGGQWVCAC